MDLDPQDLWITLILKYKNLETLKSMYAISLIISQDA